MFPGGMPVSWQVAVPLESVALQDWPVEVVMVTVPVGGVLVPLETVAVQVTVVPYGEVCGVQDTVVVVG